MAINLCTVLRVHTETGSYSTSNLLTAYLGAPLNCHFYLSIQVSFFLSCWWYSSNYTPLSIIKQNPAERCLCTYQVFNRALILSDTSMQIRQQCPCKNNLPWLENSLLQHLGRPQHMPHFPIALTNSVVAWFFLLPGIHVGCGLLVIVLYLQQRLLQSCLQALQLTCHTVKHLLCCKMWAFMSMNLGKKCFITILSGLWTRQWPHSIKEPSCGRWGCQSVQSDVF